MRGIVRDIVLRGLSSALSKTLLQADLTRILVNAKRFGGLDERQVEDLRRDVEERLRRAEAEGREQRELLAQVARELLTGWIPRGPRPPEDP
jgi:sRNA-binding protein